MKTKTRKPLRVPRYHVFNVGKDYFDKLEREKTKPTLGDKVGTAILSVIGIGLIYLWIVLGFQILP